MAGIVHRRWVRTGHVALCATVLCTGIAVATAHQRNGDPCGSGRPPLGAADVLRCVGDDIAHVTTPTGAGSAVLLPDGRLLTNAHVVDPFASVQVAFRDGETIEDVPVVGVDLHRDVAVLGPIDRSSDVVLANVPTIDAMTQGAPLFLVGYPGDIEPFDTTPAISQGIFARERTAERLGGFRYLQTDASIGGGQSGGALVDGEGRVVGISGLAFAHGFALALAAPDVEAAVDAIEDGGSDYQPTGVDQVESGTYPRGRGDDPPMRLSWIPDDEDRDVELEFDGRSGSFVEVNTLAGDTLWASDDLFGLIEDEEMLDLDPELLEDILEEEGRRGDDGVAEFTIPAGEMAVATLVTPGRGEADFRTSVPATAHRDEDNGEVIDVGARVARTIGSFEFFDDFEIELEEGQAIDIYVGSVGADMSFAVYRKSAGYEDAVFVDDSQEGFYGTDAHRTFTAERSGTHVIEVASMFPGSYGYVLDVRKG